MKNGAWYVAEAKRKLGDRAMSDRELGERLGGYVQQNIARSKKGYMTDPIALSIAQAIGCDAGEILWVARAEREKDVTIKAALMAYAKKALSAVPTKALSVAGPLAVALSMLVPAHDARAGTVAEAVRFELTDGLHRRQFSRLIHSTALARLQAARIVTRSPLQDTAAKARRSLQSPGSCACSHAT